MTNKNKRIVEKVIYEGTYRFLSDFIKEVNQKLEKYPKDVRDTAEIGSEIYNIYDRTYSRFYVTIWIIETDEEYNSRMRSEECHKQRLIDSEYKEYLKPKSKFEDKE